MTELCVSVFAKVLLQYHFVAFMAYDDGITVAQVGQLEMPNSTNYMALSASTDAFANKVLAIKGYTKTEYSCMIGSKLAPIWIQGKLVSKA